MNLMLWDVLFDSQGHCLINYHYDLISLSVNLGLVHLFFLDSSIGFNNGEAGPII